MEYVPYEVFENPGLIFATTLRLFRFEGTNLGASVIQGLDIYGGNQDLWELAVCHYISDWAWNICYCTPITDYFVRSLTEDGVQSILAKIDALGFWECSCGDETTIVRKRGEPPVSNTGAGNRPQTWKCYNSGG